MTDEAVCRLALAKNSPQVLPAPVTKTRPSPDALPPLMYRHIPYTHLPPS